MYAQKRTPVIPFTLFSQSPEHLYKVVEAAGLSDRELNVLEALFKLIDFSETERILNIDPYTGWTCEISHGKLAKRCLNSERTIRLAIANLEAAGLMQNLPTIKKLSRI